ncbi:MAG: hypothetical protein JXP34_03690, partial [Planctomycetes bacterium]|nr:hypothetical protein [Planctomycetota bacterium]
MRRTVLRTVLGAMAVALVLSAGCGKSGSPESAGEGKKETPKAADSRWARLEKTVANAEAQAAKVRFDGLPTLIRSVKSALEINRGAPPALTGKLQSILDSLQVRFRTELEALFTQVKKEIDAKVEIGDYAPAYERWDAFESMLAGEISQLEFGKEIAARARAEKSAVERLSHAEHAYLRIIDLARMHGETDPARAVAYCEGFPDEFADTKYGEEIRALRDKAYAAYAATKTTAQDIAPDVPFEDVPIQGALTHPPGEGVWTFTGEEMRVENTGSSQAIAEIGSEQWIDYVIEFEAKVETDSGFWVGARAQEDKLSGRLNYQFQKVEASAGDWRRFR